MERPKVRPLEAFPVEHDGKPSVCVRDPMCLAPGVAFVPHPVYFLMTLMDGQRSILDIQEAYVRQFGNLIFSEQIKKIVQQLDENLFLESDRFRTHRKNVEEEFRKAAVRKPSHAGGAYPDSPDQLRQTLDECLAEPADTEPQLPDKVGQPIRGLMVPHIDFARGAPAYGAAYRTLAAAGEADLFVILGVGHSLEGSLYTATAKDFETPFGVMKTDREFVEGLVGACGEELMKEEFAHRMEHSIEFQVVFLQHLIDDWQSKRIVPVLCGSFQEMLLVQTNPWENAGVERFTTSLGSLLQDCGSRWMMIAAVDLSHVGAHFGDQESLSEGFLARIRAEDEKLLAAFEKGDEKELFAHIRKDGDRRRVCGALAMYTMLVTLQPERTTVLHYEQCVTPETQTCVTVAAAAVC
jgi:AmmeMemoRadiSam system protein B